jgi:hypothetical protein
MGGFGGELLSVATGGLIESPSQKKAEAAQKKAIKKQQSLLDKQTARESTSLTRRASLASGAGAQSLLSGSMLGTEVQKTTLG